MISRRTRNHICREAQVDHHRIQETPPMVTRQVAGRGCGGDRVHCRGSMRTVSSSVSVSVG